MHDERASATAYLIALSLALSAADARLGPLQLDAHAAALSARLVSACSGRGRRLLRALRRSVLLRALVRLVERLTLPGIQLHYALRKRYLEECARRALTDGIGQVCVLGAGLDTLALRLSATHPATLFIEFDHPATQRSKVRALRAIAHTRAAHAHAPANLHLIPLDFSRQNLDTALSADGSPYRASAPALFIAEGLLMYLDACAVARLFASVRAHAGAGGLFAFTFIEPQACGRFGFRRASWLLGAWLRWRGEPFRWGVARAELPALLAAHGFRLAALATPDTLRGRYLAPAGLAHLPLAEGECVCVAACP